MRWHDEAMPFEHELILARYIARAAGENACRIQRGHFSSETKADGSPVTAADQSNELLIREALEREFPLDGILGEEGAAKAGSSGRRWIIDPIDGTRDFVKANRFWCVLIALEEAQESLVGVAHFPLLNETYWASRGHGAWRNGDPLKASQVSRIEDCCFCPNGLSLAQARPHLAAVMDLAQQSWSVRSYGGALDACMVASGQADVWFEPKVAPWDLAPLRVILEEAGAAFFALDGSRSIEQGSALACAPALTAEVRRAFGVPPLQI
jgi:histidinol phosphatase-like enzyme (inositol monophosphatase family)